MGEVSYSVSGFKIVGCWEDIVRHGDIIAENLNEMDIESDYQECIKEWEDWRPKEGEDLDDEVRDKTAQMASVEKGQREKENVKAREDAEKAVKKVVVDTPKYAIENDIKVADGSLKQGVENVKRAVDSAGRKTLRFLEETVYKTVMTAISPQFFDNSLISANIKKNWTINNNNEDSFIFEVNINDDDIKQKMKNNMEDSGYLN